MYTYVIIAPYIVEYRRKSLAEMSVSVHKGTVFRNALVYGSEGGGGGYILHISYSTVICLYLSFAWIQWYKHTPLSTLVHIMTFLSSQCCMRCFEDSLGRVSTNGLVWY